LGRSATPIRRELPAAGMTTQKFVEDSFAILRQEKTQPAFLGMNSEIRELKRLRK
jgi:hypothetical protein